MLDYAGGFKNEWWTRLAGTTQNGMRRAIQTNIATGAPLRDLERSLEPLFGKTRAQVIASTETTRMYAEGNKLAYKSAGVGEVEFQTVKDSAVDPDCEALQDKRFPIDSAPTPPIHPRCRCWIAPVVCREVESKVLVGGKIVSRKEEICNALTQPVGEEIPAAPSQLEDLSKLDMKERRSAWNKLSQVEQDRIANAPTSIGQEIQRITGGIEPGSPRAMVKQAVDSGLIPKQHARLIQSYTDDFAKLAKKSGWDEKLIFDMSDDMTRTLISQEHATLSRTLGDHGIRHLTGDVRMASDILKTAPGGASTEDFLMMRLAGAYHDVGYLTRPAQLFLDQQHARWSGQYFNAVLRKRLVESPFGRGRTNLLGKIIRTHDSAEISWKTANDTLASAFRMADNLALFQAEKLPALIELVPGNIEVMIQFGAQRIGLAEARAAMLSNIQRSSLNPLIKAQLGLAADELSPVFSKYTIGQMFGRVRGFRWQGDGVGRLIVDLERTADNPALANVMDLGQMQFKKLAQTYGQTADDLLSAAGRMELKLCADCQVMAEIRMPFSSPEEMISRLVSKYATAARTREIRAALEMLPSQVLNELKGFELFDFVAAGRKLVMGTADRNSGWFRLSPTLKDWQLRKTTIHEVIHATEQHWGPVVEALKNRLVELQDLAAYGKKVQAVTNYALTNRAEYVAETLTFWLLDPTLLAARDPKAYKIVMRFLG